MGVVEGRCPHHALPGLSRGPDAGSKICVSSAVFLQKRLTFGPWWGILLKSAKYGPVAQLGERSVRIREVKGSNPSRSTILCKSELNLLCEALFRIFYCFRGCGSGHILFFRRIVSKRLFSIPDASRGRVSPANPRTAHAQPLQRNKNKKPLTSNEISGFWQG